MKKALIIILVVIAVIIGVYYWRKKAGIAKKDDTPLPDVAPPAVTATDAVAGLFNADSGSGKTAVEKRSTEIIANETALSDALDGINRRKLTEGLTYIGPILENNIDQSTGSSGMSGVPIILTSAQKTAVKGLANFSYLGPGYWDDLRRIIFQAVDVKDQVGIRMFAPADMNPNDLNPARMDLLFFIRKDAIKGNKWDTGRLGDALGKLISDVNKFGNNWLRLNDDAAKSVKEKAIADLRAAGWRFVGYDAPQT